MTDKSAIQHLETFVIDNALLNELEIHIAEFNIFEAMGTVRQELRHSDFIAFLLNPSEKHSLDDRFLKQFLIKVLIAAENPPITPITIKVTDFSNALIEREAQHIDILISDSESGIVCLIENKVFSEEHSDQLGRYLRTVRRRFPDARVIIPVFLTPDGIPPQNENSPYIPFSYADVADVIERVRQTQQSMLGADVNTMIQHYATMLRRYILSDSDIAKLCRQIYQSHKQAIDLIIEHMPDLRQDISDYLIELVDSTPELDEVRYSKSYVNFRPVEWSDVPEFNMGTGWANSNATLSLEFENASTHLNLYLRLGPVDPVHQPIRETLYQHVNTHPELFKGCSPKLSEKWTKLYKLPLLSKSDYEDATLDELTTVIEPKWRHFLENILPEMNQHLLELEFDEPDTP